MTVYPAALLVHGAEIRLRREDTIIGYYITSWPICPRETAEQRLQWINTSTDSAVTSLFAAISVDASAATSVCYVAKMCFGTDDVIAVDLFALSFVEAHDAVGDGNIVEMCSKWARYGK